MATEKIIPDWERIEIDYRAGIKSLREIAGEHGLSDTAIRKRAKRDSWSRDLSAKIKAKSDDMVRRQMVRTEVRTVTRISEQEVIEANAQAITDIKLNQRKDIVRSRTIAMTLFDELEHMIGINAAQDLQDLGELMRSDDDKGRDVLNDIYMKAISLPGRVKSMKELSETLKTLIGLERQAFGLDDKDNSPVDSLTKLLHTISKSNANAFQVIEHDPEYDD